MDIDKYNSIVDNIKGHMALDDTMEVESLVDGYRMFINEHPVDRHGEYVDEKSYDPDTVDRICTLADNQFAKVFLEKLGYNAELDWCPTLITLLDIAAEAGYSVQQTSYCSWTITPQ